MKVLHTIASELIGLFLDDAFLAMAVLAVSIAAAALSLILHASGLLVGGVIVLGCASALVVSSVAGARG
jgi:hypothetical protein